MGVPFPFVPSGNAMIHPTYSQQVMIIFFSSAIFFIFLQVPTEAFDNDFQPTDRFDIMRTLQESPPFGAAFYFSKQYFGSNVSANRYDGSMYVHTLFRVDFNLCI